MMKKYEYANVLIELKNKNNKVTQTLLFFM